MDVDPDWSEAELPTREEMLKWAENDLSKLSTFPAIYDLMEQAKTHSSEISALYSFKNYMGVA